MLGGHLADTCGCHRTIVGYLGFGAITMVLLSQAQALEAILAMTFFNGLRASKPDPEPGRFL